MSVSHVQVSYADKHRLLGYQVMVNTEPVLDCSVAFTKSHAHREISCHTGAVMYIEQGDQVYVKDTQGNRTTIRDPARTFFGLVKLTADWI